MKQHTLIPEFVETVPVQLQEGRIYVSIAYSTAVHKCCCGCGLEVVTPLSPTDWKLIYDGRSISLDPSIGNWGFPCRSHYWIRSNRIQWAPKWSQSQIDSGRAYDIEAKREYFEQPQTKTSSETKLKSKKTWWQRLKEYF